MTNLFTRQQVRAFLRENNLKDGAQEILAIDEENIRLMYC